MLHPYSLLDSLFLIIEDELIDLFRVNVLLFFFFVAFNLFFDFASRFLEEEFGVIAEHFRVALILVSFTSLLKLSLDSSELLLEDVFRDVEVISESFPWDFFHLISVGQSCYFFLYFSLIFEFFGFHSGLDKCRRVHFFSIELLFFIIFHLLELLFGQFSNAGPLELL